MFDELVLLVRSGVVFGVAAGWCRGSLWFVGGGGFVRGVIGCEGSLPDVAWVGLVVGDGVGPPRDV